MPVLTREPRSALPLAILAAAALAAAPVRPAAAADPAPAAAPAPAGKPAAEKAGELDLGQKKPAPAAVLEEITGTVAAVDRQTRRIELTTAKGPVTLGLDRNTLVYTQAGLGTALDIAPGQPIRAGRNAQSVAYWVQIRPAPAAKPAAPPAPEAAPPAAAPAPATPAPATPPAASATAK